MPKPESPYRLYGRQVGHGGLRPAQQQRMERLLPKLELADQGDTLDLTAVFGRACPVWLEIGFGAGEHLLWQAQQNPDVGFIGVEPFITGVSSCLYGVERDGIDNVRICMGDGRPLIDRLPDASIETVFILHPDPWPKWRHAKRRLIQPALLDALARIMPEGAQLRIGTDWADYSCWALRHLLNHQAFAWQARSCRDWQERPADWPVTRYAVKAEKEGRCDVHLTFLRV